MTQSGERLTSPERSAVAPGRLRGSVAFALDRMARRPVLSVFVIALIVRAIAAIVITIGWHGSLFLDDASYSRLAESAANGTIHDPYLDFLYERTATLLVPVAGLYKVFGPVHLLGQLYVALLGAATAALTARLAMEVIDRRWALLAGLILAFLPSQVLWSSLILKDAAVWAALSGLAVVVALSHRADGRRLAMLAAIAAVLLVLLGYLRLQTLEVAGVALVLAVLVVPRPRLLARLGGAVALLVCIPLAFGMGAAGASFVAHSRDPGEQRALNALQASTAVVKAPVPASPGKPAAPPPVDTSVAGASLRYLPTGITVVGLRPWPWESASASPGVRLARLETIVWYPLLLLALIGLTAIWRHRRALAFPVLVGGATLAMYGLTEGNLGTAYRHRGEFVWVVALLATVGVERIVAWRRWRRPVTACA